jgi:ribosomal protein S27AE
MLNDQMIVGAHEDAEVRDALAHCPRCGSGRFSEVRERR